MAEFVLSKTAEEDLIRIHQFGVKKFGVVQADKYFMEFFECFERIAQNPYAFPAVDFIKEGYRRCVYGSESIYYRLGENRVEIMILIGSQDMENII